MAAVAEPAREARILGVLERLAVAMLLLAALVPRVRDLAGGFDREMEGAQGAFFALAALNYQRVGAGVASGYPVLNLDLPAAGADGAVEPREWYVYANHPPLVPWIAWGALAAFGRDGWDEAWREGRAPEGVEMPLRMPFLLLHGLGLLAAWWAVRAGHGARAALLALGLLAVTPVSVVYAHLVNYENAALPPLLVAYGFAARHLRSGAPRDLAWCCAGFALAGCFTWAPLAFVPALAWPAWRARRPGRGLVLVGAAGIAAALPLLAHALASRHALARLGLPPDGTAARARLLLAPLLDGSAPLTVWLGIQAGALARWFTVPLLAAGLLGLVALLRARRPAGPDVRGIDLATPLLLGGALVQLAFYRHTLDPQPPFLLWLAPGIAALAAAWLDALAPALARLRAGIAPLVVLASGIGLFGVQRANHLRHALRAPAGEASPSGAPAPELPLPRQLGADLARLLPPRSLGVVPSELGLNLAAAFYAWRTLWPTTGPADTAPQAVAERFGLAAAPRFLVLPRDPPPSARAQVEALREALAPGEADAQDADWRAWRLR